MNPLRQWTNPFQVLDSKLVLAGSRAVESCLLHFDVCELMCTCFDMQWINFEIAHVYESWVFDHGVDHVPYGAGLARYYYSYDNSYCRF